MAPKDEGGLAVGSQTIGIIMATMGVPLVIYQLLVYPRITAKLGAVNTFRLAAYILTPLVCFYPFIVSFLTDVFHSAPAAVVVFLCVKHSMATQGFTSSFLLINNSVSADQRGAVNGMALTIASISKAAFPVIAPSILAFSLTHDYPFPADVHLVFLVMGLLSLVTVVLLAKLPSFLNSSWETRHPAQAPTDGGPNAAVDAAVKRDAAAGSGAGAAAGAGSGPSEKPQPV